MPAAAPTPRLLWTEALAVGRSGTPLLEGVGFGIAPGESWFLLGRNGSGKTTLLSTLLGLLRPRAGRIGAAADVADRTALGYVPQELRFQGSLPVSVDEFVRLGLTGLRLSGPAAAERTGFALATLQVASLRERRWTELSLGQRRRVLVARALARAPRLLVLDEPTANLDPHGSVALAADLEDLRRDRGMALLHASHDLALARRFATHVALVRTTADGPGRLLTGTAAAVLDAPPLHQELGCSS